MSTEPTPREPTLSIADLEQVAGGIESPRDVATGQASGLFTNDTIDKLGNVQGRKISSDYLLK